VILCAVVGRLTVISLGLLAAFIPPTFAMRRQHGPMAAARFAAGSMLAILAQQSLVGMAASRREARLGAVDLMTLSRGAAAALLLGIHASGVRCRTGFAGWLGWASLVYGSVVCDWLDGPLARRLGETSPLGALLDLEGDSWLTLVTASSAVTWGGLPGYCAVAPPAWARPLGIAQMSLFTAALAPFGAAGTRLVVRLATPIVAAFQLLGTALMYRRSQRVLGI
jgi:phosphatidylglycerophosphate synthase